MVKLMDESGTLPDSGLEISHFSSKVGAAEGAGAVSWSVPVGSPIRNGCSAVDEVQAMLREDPTFLPVPGQVESRLGEIDFTACGATLYRRMAAEWLGTDWEEDALSVWNDYYREEHRYCEAEEGLRGIVQEHIGRGEVVRASKLVPVGPWCVYWWERFSAGYRLELKIGEP
jgi:hypothetical protein